MPETQLRSSQSSEQGFMLVGLIVAIFLILLALGVAAPRVARALRRDREVEAVHRGNQYVRAVQLYYRKVGHYPGSLEQLEKTNNIRFLRQRYADPMTGKPDWRLIHVGEAKTTVKGFFGKPLAGLPNSGGIGSGINNTTGYNPNDPTPKAGSTAGSSASGSSSSFGSSSFGSSGSSGSSFSGSSSAGSSFGSSTGAGSQTGSSFGSISGNQGNGNNGAAGTTAGSSTGIGSQSATSFSGTGAPIMGVSSISSGDSIIVLNEQTSYPKWEFIYDPRIEQLKAKSGLLGGGVSGSGSGLGAGSTNFGSGFSNPGSNGTTNPANTTPTTSPSPSPSPSTPPQ